MRIFLAILLLTIAAGAGAAGENPSSQNLLFILDASGSMWGRIDGTPKISVAKEVMSGLVADLPDDARAGLTAYGHRRKGDCSDIQSLVGLDPLDRDAMIDKIQGLNPKGKTPITGSVKQAIDQLRRVEESASVVLVSDGLESCGGDPCEAVKAAKKSGVDFTLHVVGFDLGETDTSQLQCMADAGGGEFFTAANADELTGALKKAVETKPGLVLRVVSNGKPTPARATIFRAADKDSARKKVETASLGETAEDNPQRITLAPGSYEVQVKATALDGDRQKTLTELEIPKKGVAKRTVDFSDGAIELMVTSNDKPINAYTYVYKAGTKDEAAREHTGKDGLARYELTPGDYDIKIRPRDISAPNRRVEGITVTYGETTHKSVDYGIGTAELKVTANSKPINAYTYVYKAGTKDEAAREHTGKDGLARYRVLAGTYDIKIRPRGISAPNRWVKGMTVTAGETTHESVDYASGTARITVTTNGEPLKARTYIQHSDTHDEAGRDGTNGEGVASYTIPTGNYRIQIRPDGISAPDHFVKDVTVKAGETTEKTLDIPSGTAQVTVTTNGKPLQARTYIQHSDTHDEAGRDWTDDEGVASYTIPTGNYRIQIRPDGISAPDEYIEDVTVRAGETTRKSIDITQPDSGDE